MHYILDKVKSSKIARFVISGGTAAASLFLTLYILKEIFHVWYLAASIIAFCVSICINFAFQKFWVFQKHTTEKIHKESAYFLGLSLFNLLLNSGLMYLFVDKAHMNYILSQFIIAILLAIWNFVLYGFIFKDEPVPTPYA